MTPLGFHHNHSPGNLPSLHCNPYYHNRHPSVLSPQLPLMQHHCYNHHSHHHHQLSNAAATVNDSTTITALQFHCDHLILIQCKCKE